MSFNKSFQFFGEWNQTVEISETSNQTKEIGIMIYGTDFQYYWLGLQAWIVPLKTNNPQEDRVERPIFFSQRLACGYPVPSGWKHLFCSEAPMGNQQGSIEVHAANGHIENMKM